MMRSELALQCIKRRELESAASKILAMTDLRPGRGRMVRQTEPL